MVDLNPFLSRPGEWVDDLIALREQRKKIEKREKRLQIKLMEYIESEGVPAVQGTKHEAKIKKTKWRGLPRAALSLTKIRTPQIGGTERTEAQVKADIKRVFG